MIFDILVFLQAKPNADKSPQMQMYPRHGSMKRTATEEEPKRGDKKLKSANESKFYNPLTELEFGGIPIEWLVSEEKVKSLDLICSICFQCLYMPHGTHCGHMFCGTCCAELQKNHQPCPVCGSVQTKEDASSSKYVQRILDMQGIKCPNALHVNARHVKDEPRCAWTGTVATLNAHLQQCPHMGVRCVLCNLEMARSELEEHQAILCPQRQTKCEICDAKVIWEDMERHKTSTCKHAPAKCKWCENMFTVCTLDNHVNNECDVYSQPCPYSMCGFECRPGVIFDRGALAQHLKSNVMEHVALVNQWRKIYVAGQELCNMMEEHLSSLHSILQPQSLHIAASNNNPAAINCLVYMGFDINAGWKGMTPLMWAANHGALESTRTLLLLNANVNLVSVNHPTALHIAALHGHLEVVKTLIETGKCHPGVLTTSKQTPATLTTKKIVQDYLRDQELRCVIPVPALLPVRDLE
jgi:hypothetical protein